MNPVNRTFAILIALVFGGTIVVAIGLSVSEYIARANLPPEEQTAEAIQRLYDGAVCLGCDIAKYFVLIFGSLASLTLTLLWVIYEAVVKLSENETLSSK